MTFSQENYLNDFHFKLFFMNILNTFLKDIFWEINCFYITFITSNSSVNKMRTSFDGKQNQTDGKACACSAFSSPEEFSFRVLHGLCVIIFSTREFIEWWEREKHEKQFFFPTFMCMLPYDYVPALLPLYPTGEPSVKIYKRIVFHKKIISSLCTLAFHVHSLGKK